MCGLNGITVSIEFDQIFTGKIYSLNYANVHECIYYNAQEMKNVLFTIPLHRCGTRVTRNTREIIDTVENRVYVQMEKFTQTSLDRQYSFLCELVHSKAVLGINGNSPQSFNSIPAVTNNIRRHPARTQIGNNLPVIPESSQQNPIQPMPSYHNTFPLIPQSPLPSPLPPLPPMPPYQRNEINPQQNSIPLSSSSFNPFISQRQAIVPSNLNYPNERQWNQQQQNSVVPQISPVTSPPSSFTPESIADRKSHSLSPPLQSSSNYYNNKEKSELTQQQNTNFIINDEKNNNINESNFTKKLPIHSSTEPVRIYATQQINKSEALGNVYLEIQEGDGPRANTVNNPVKIGDKITLVIRSEDVPKDVKQYNIFVHSCYASDGPGTTRIELIDKAGCGVSSQIIGQMQRERDEKTIIYFFKLTAFKFPGPDDVYFSCLVDISPNYNFPELCQKNNTDKRILTKRELITANVDSIPLFNDIKVNLEDNDDSFCLL
uniref:ZP domain-containing protein n=1 Tax=Panagrolaimus sp. ES5 TaxID=591445 RepID=A0AC34G3S5_9BILA